MTAIFDHVGFCEDRVNERGCDADTMIEFFMGEDYRAAHEKFLDTFEEYFAGRSRVTYIGDDYVYKVPMNEMGIIANFSEERECRKGNGGIPIAPCELIEDGNVLKMEKVTTIPMEDLVNKDFPDWVATIDSAQVGYLPNGDLVAYDL